ncbi:VUT family protein [Lacihabitans sp. LS3-19]|uniref:queuosine precursor transporter n=1 Tax=Lacihabitans sp. LS3-19 TaxID=2487335 RepID=UPI0020CB8ADC|nr:queuosine precursor transporter [Lacihabitans sp. LS3-19]MCP9769964.1 VUT family protein [Lacihabitans sp. LS3-19]
MTFTANKKQILFIILCGIFITNAIVAEIIGAKIFSLEATLGLNPAQIDLLGYKLDFNMTAGVLNWPIVFIISDIINEYFGVKGVKIISYLTTVLIVYTFFLLYGAASLPPAQFWLDVNSVDKQGNSLNINNAFGIILRQGMGIIIGSVIAFLLGQMLDALIFRKIRQMTSNKHIWLRSTGSTVVSQMIDSFVVIFIAFYLFGNWKFSQIIAVGSVNYVYKFFIAILMTPVIYLIHYAIDKYLGKKASDELIEEATYL